jgi:GntR family transcriptional regulator
MSQASWAVSPPIYRQLCQQVVNQILEGTLREGDALPSVRRLALELGLSPLTVLRGYRELLQAQLIEKRRGLGMFVRAGAGAALLGEERRRFLDGDWPRIRATIERLGLTAELLGEHAANAADP